MRDVRGLQNSFSSFPFLWLMAVVFLVIILTSISCSSSTSKGTKIPTYEEAKKDVEAQGLLVKPPVEKQYTFLQGGKRAGLPKGTVITIIDPDDHTKTKIIKWGALVIDEKKAAELRAIKIQRDLLLKKLEAEKVNNLTSKIIYKAGLEKAKEAAKRTWWEKNGDTVGILLGGAIGMGILTGLIYALTKGNRVTVNTNTMVLQEARR